MAVGKDRAIGVGLVVAGMVSAAPTVWWLSVVATMRGPHTEPNLTDTLSYIALSSPFLIIPAVAIVRGFYRISSAELDPDRSRSSFEGWLWLLLGVNPIAYIIWLMQGLAGM